MKRTLITGGTGMVGSQFRAMTYLNSETDLRKQKETNKVFRLYEPDYVIHTAAKVGGIRDNMNKQAKFFYDNIMINSNVIEACRKFGVGRAAFFLSTCIFPDNIEYPLTEEKIYLGAPHLSNYGYAEAKRAMEVMVRTYNEQYNTNYFCVIPCNIYGIKDNFNLEEGNVVSSLIHKCWVAKQNNTDFEIWGDGKPLREFIFSEDVVKITEKLLYETDFKGNVIISNPIEYSIKELVEIIVKIIGFRGNIVWLVSEPQGQFRKPSSIKKLENLIGDYKFTLLEEGLTKTISWFVKNYPNVRK